jgi:hypothetical protein
MSDSVLLPIPPNRIDDVWPHVREMLGEAVKSANGRLELADVRKFLIEKDLVLWVSLRNKKIEALAVTEILQHPRKKMCMVRVLTGKDYANWVGLEEGIAKWAESIGCHGMEAIARKGWSRVFKNYDFTHIYLERMFK